MRRKICYFFIGSLLNFSFLVVELSAKAFPHLRGNNNPPFEQKEMEESPQLEKHWPHYDSCQDMREQPFVITTGKDKFEEEKTEGDFCTFCDFEKSLWKNQSFRNLWSSIKETKPSLEETAFREKLKARVAGQVESKLFEIKLLKACALPLENKSWLTEMYKRESWPEIQKSCEQAIQAVKSQTKESYKEMRIQLSLADSSIKEDRILSDKATWMDSTPNHLISDFTDLPRLTKEEKNTAGKRYVTALSKIPLDILAPSEFKKKLEGNGHLYLPLSGEKYLTEGDNLRLKTEVRKLREESQTHYFEIIGQSPLLGWLKSGEPNNRELVQAYSEMEKNLTDFLENEVKAENMDILISYESLVEELLKESAGENESSKYCLTAERARIKVEQFAKVKQDSLNKLNLLSMVPCFFGGGIALSVCFGSAGLLSFRDLKSAQTAAKLSLNKRLTGPEFEKISTLKKKQKELYLAKVFFSLTFLEAGGIAKTAKSVKKRIFSKKNLEEKNTENLQLSNKPAL